MPDYGLTTEGLLIPTVQEIRDDFESEMREEYGESVPLGDGTFLGHLIGILSERLGLIWEVLEQGFSSMDPDKATGAFLEALALITGTFKADAASSTVDLVLVGDDGTVVSVGNQVSTASTAKKFELVGDDVTLEQLDAWVGGTIYAAGDRVTNSSRAYQCITGGEADASGGPTTTDADITDNDAHWTYLGEGEAAADAEAESVDTGEIIGVARDITTIETPVGGWNSVINLEDADPGRDEMTDEELRLLREAEINQAGTGPADAIRAALLQLPGVTNVRVFYNPTDTTDGDGVLPHSVEALVLGGTDQQIWQCLWDNVAAGIRTVGDEVGIVVDDEGEDQTLKFSRPDQINIWVIVDLIKDPDEYESDGDVELAITAWGNDQVPGKNAVASAISAQAFLVEGVLDVTSVLIGTADPPVASTTIAIAKRELAVYDTSRITVNSSDGEP